MERHSEPEQAANGGGRYTRALLLRRAAVGAGALAFSGVAASAAPAASLTAAKGFLELSRVVTGTRHLPVGLAPSYLKALEEAGLEMPVSRLLDLTGYADARGPRTLAGLHRSPALREKGATKTAKVVAAAWWSGMVPTRAGGRRVITYDGALVWRLMPYARPPSTCLGTTHSWTTPGTRVA